MGEETVVGATKTWLEGFVIGHDICPFAGREVSRGRVRFVVCESDQATDLLKTLYDEISHLVSDSSVATTLLIHPNVLTDFSDYNQFLDVVDALLQEEGFTSEYQVASFHPDYQFADAEADSTENFTNRSPYPILHILRESDVTKAVDSHADISEIPKQNIKLMQQIGFSELQSRLFALQGK